MTDALLLAYEAVAVAEARAQEARDVLMRLNPCARCGDVREAPPESWCRDCRAMHKERNGDAP